MAVRVPLELRHPSGGVVETVAVLNGGFEMDGPHLLLPAQCAERLDSNYGATGVMSELATAGGSADFRLLDATVRACVRTPDRIGQPVDCQVLVSEAENEVLVSDEAIDALGIRIETFRPPNWRFADEQVIRKGSVPQIW